MIFVLAGTFVFGYIRLAIKRNASFYSDAPVTTITAFFAFRETGITIGGVIPFSRIVNATRTSFVNSSAIVNTTTTSFVNSSVIV